MSVFQHLHGADLFGSGLGARFFNGLGIRIRIQGRGSRQGESHIQQIGAASVGSGLVDCLVDFLRRVFTRYGRVGLFLHFADAGSLGQGFADGLVHIPAVGGVQRFPYVIFHQIHGLHGGVGNVSGLGCLCIACGDESVNSEEACFLIFVIFLVLVPEGFYFLFSGIRLGAEGAFFQEGGVDCNLLTVGFCYSFGKTGLHGDTPGQHILDALQADGVFHQPAQQFLLKLFTHVAAHGNEIIVFLGVENAFIVLELWNIANGIVNFRGAGSQAQAPRLPADNAAVGQESRVGIICFQQMAEFAQVFFRAEIVLKQRTEGGRERESHGQAGPAHIVIILFPVRFPVHGNESLLEHAGQGAAAYVPADEHEAHKHQGHGCHDDDCMFT